MFLTEQKNKCLAKKKNNLHTQELSFDILIFVRATLTINCIFVMQNKQIIEFNIEFNMLQVENKSQTKLKHLTVNLRVVCLL